MADEELPAGWEKRLSRSTGTFITGLCDFSRVSLAIHASRVFAFGRAGTRSPNTINPNDDGSARDSSFLEAIVLGINFSNFSNFSRRETLGCCVETTENSPRRTSFFFFVSSSKNLALSKNICYEKKKK